jgi:hypothetical protein
MGNHRRVQASRRGAAASRTHGTTDRPRDSLAPAAAVDDGIGRDPGPQPVTGRALEDLVDAARVARRAGRAFGAEILSSADTRRMRALSPDDALPRRYATSQPTTPMRAQSEH